MIIILIIILRSMSQRETKATTKDDRPHFKNEISSKALLASAKELVILHNDERYILRVTANDKLILTK